MEDCVPGRLMFRDDSTGIWWPFSCRHSTRAECPSAGPMSCDVVAVSLVVSSAVTRRLSVPPNLVDRPNVVVSLTLQAAYQIDVWDGSNLSHNGYSCEVAEIGARVEKIIFHLDFRPRPTCSRIISSHPFPPCHTKPTWCDIIGRLQTKHIDVICLRMRKEFMVNEMPVTGNSMSLLENTQSYNNIHYVQITTLSNVHWITFFLKTREHDKEPKDSIVLWMRISISIYDKITRQHSIVQRITCIE